jgi:hypothetical protein
MDINLKFTIDEINELLTALGQLPYTYSFQLIQNIHNQAIPQIQAANAEKVEPEVVNG